MMFPEQLRTLANDVLVAARGKGLMIATAESCTGGLVSALLTDIAGSSDVFERGFVAYANESKQDMLGVEEDTIATFGAVSEETAAEMADGALDSSRAHIAVSLTGIAGPSGGTAEKPVGLVYIGIASSDGTVRTVRNVFKGDRSAIRAQAAEKALQELLTEISAV